MLTSQTCTLSGVFRLTQKYKQYGRRVVFYAFFKNIKLGNIPLFHVDFQPLTNIIIVI